MASYTPLPTSDFSESENVNFTSPLSYHEKYRSIFTYNTSSSLFIDELVSGHINFSEKLCTKLVIILSYILIIITSPISLFFVIKIIPKHERIVVFRLGRMRPIIGPGTVCVIPIVDQYQRIDLRMKAFSIPPQQVIISDDAIVEVGGEIRFRIANIPRATMNIRDIENSLRTTGKNILVNNLSRKCLSQLENDKQWVNLELLQNFNEIVDKWGLQVVHVEISQIQILQKNQHHHPALGRLFQALQNSFSTPPVPTMFPTNPTRETDTSLPTKSGSKIIDRLREILQSADTFSDMNGVFEVQITNGGVLVISIQNGKSLITTQNTSSKPADVVIAISEDDLLDVCNNVASPLQLYLNGRVKVSGDLSLLLKLDSLIQKSTIITI